MKNNVEQKFYETRIVPFVRYETINKNGKEMEIAVDNLTSQEVSKMSCEPRIFRRIGKRQYIAENPLIFNGGTSIRGLLCYVFSELTEEEQNEFMDRSIVIQTTEPEVVIVYGEESKKIFGKRKTRKK